MRPFIRTILIWFLTLSLTGLPVVSMSQDMGGSASSALDQYRNVTMTVATSQTMRAHCHSGVVAAGDKVAVPDVQDSIASSSTKKCSCGDECQCQHDTDCQSISHSSNSAIFQSTWFISSPLNSQLAIESTVSYHDCDADSEIIPPIV